MYEDIHYVIGEPLSQHIEPETLRSLSKSFRSAAEPAYRESTRLTEELCTRPVTLDEVLSLGGHFIVAIRLKNGKTSVVMAENRAGRYILRGIAKFYTDGIHQPSDFGMQYAHPSKLAERADYVRFDTGTVLKVLTKVRGCNANYAKRLIVDDINLAVKELSYDQHALHWYLNMSLSYGYRYESTELSEMSTNELVDELVELYARS